MENIPENNFFELTLSQQGASWLMRLHKVVRLLFISVISISVVWLLNVAMRYRIYMRYTAKNWIFTFQAKIYPLIEVLALSIALIQGYYFLKFSRINKKSIEMQQPELFNESFKWLYKMAVVAAILNLIQFIMICIGGYAELVIYRTSH